MIFRICENLEILLWRTSGNGWGWFFITILVKYVGTHLCGCPVFLRQNWNALFCPSSFGGSRYFPKLRLENSVGLAHENDTGMQLAPCASFKNRNATFCPPSFWGSRYFLRYASEILE